MLRRGANRAVYDPAEIWSTLAAGRFAYVVGIN
ncbi:MAG: hypothetical protein ACI9CV_002125 [Ilumatobacter sp.]|jgi:hypothetical protein